MMDPLMEEARKLKSGFRQVISCGHRKECVATGFLRYSVSAHDAVSSGFVTREESPHHARTASSVSTQGAELMLVRMMRG